MDRREAIGEIHDFEFDSEMSDECARCGREHIGWVSASPQLPPAPIRPAGARHDAATLSGCAALLAGAGLFVAGIGLGALYLIAAIREVF